MTYRNPNYQRDYHRRYRKTKGGRALLWKINKKWRDSNREKIRATDKLRYAIKTGKIKKPKFCSKCKIKVNGRLLHGHHKDYSKPLKVNWLCSKCHTKISWRIKK